MNARKAFVWGTQFTEGPFRQFYEALRHDPKWITLEVDAGHDMMIDKPDHVSELLEQLAAA